MSEIWHDSIEHPTTDAPVLAVFLNHFTTQSEDRFFYHLARFVLGEGWMIVRQGGESELKGRHDLSILCWTPIMPPDNIAEFCPLCRGIGYTGASGALSLCDCQLWLGEVNS